MKRFLHAALLYNAFQRFGGFFGARLRAFRDYLDLTSARRVFDIGCGPGHIVEYMPPSVEYVGFDTDTAYISFARRRFGHLGKFVDRPFDRSAVLIYGAPDLILMNGVLHHMDENDAIACLADAAAALTNDGVFFSLDGCFEAGQSALARYLLEHDRGKFVRTADHYERLVRHSFSDVDVHVRHDLSWVPYTFAIVCASRDGTRFQSRAPTT